MELRQLEYLVAIAEERSFTAAAARVRVAQPAVSAQIAALEREVGQRLLTRTPRGAVPTDAGAELVGHARAVLGRLAEAHEAMQALAGLVRGRVSVGLIRGAPLGRLGTCLGEFRREHAGVDVSVREGETADLLAGLTDGSVDLALVGLAGDPPTDVVTRVVLVAAMDAFVAPEDPWSTRASVRLAGLVERPLVTLSAGTGVRTALDAACRSRGVTARVAGEVGTVGAALELAREGLGVAVVPGDAGAGLAPDLHRVVVRPAIRSRLALAWHTRTVRDGRPAARALIAAVDRSYTAS